jgi:ABC-type multidrug transport system fused ATPase/permease subunit
MIIIFGVGGGAIAKLSKKVVAEYSSAATVAEEVLSSIRTAQAFGTEEKLANHYDESLIVAQKVGYKKGFAMAMMFAAIFTLVYLTYGLAFCIIFAHVADDRGRISTDCRGRIECRPRDECSFRCDYRYLLALSDCTED